MVNPRWVYDEDTDKIHFTVQSNHTDLWTGIGFSDTPQMVRPSLIFFILVFCPCLTYNYLPRLRLDTRKSPFQASDFILRGQSNNT